MADDTRSEALGKRCRLFRERRRLTRKTLAERSQLSLRFLAEIEAGRANPSLSTLDTLARAFDVDLFALLAAGNDPAQHQALAAVDALSEVEAKAWLKRMGGLSVDVARPVVLVGLRGAGKSSVGKALARRAGRPFLELDELVEREAGMGLGALFELHGERRYRELERQMLDGALKDERRPVIALSGGGMVDDGTRAALTARATTVWLKARPQDHWDRVIAQGDKRPMHGRSKARVELEELFRRREPLYATSDVVIDTSDRSIDDVVRDLVAKVAPQPGAHPRTSRGA